jgi:hypothetical protein
VGKDMEELVALVLSQHSPGNTDENYKNPPSGQQTASRNSNLVPPNISLHVTTTQLALLTLVIKPPLFKAHHWKQF